MLRVPRGEFFDDRFQFSEDISNQSRIDLLGGDGNRSQWVQPIIERRPVWIWRVNVRLDHAAASILNDSPIGEINEFATVATQQVEMNRHLLNSAKMS